MRVKASSALPFFRSELQLRLLGLLLLEPTRKWTSAELRQRLGATEASVHRELHRALRAGLIEREQIGHTFRYRAAIDSPLFEPLQTLLERTVGVEVELQRVLARLPGVVAAAIHGSFARRTAVRPTSDVDLLILGVADVRDLRKQIRPVEQRTGRQIDVTVFEPAELQNLLKQGNSFARGIRRGPLVELVGSVEDVLGGA